MINASRILIFLFILLISNSCPAFPQYGATFSYALIPKEPSSLRGYQFMFNYDPGTLNWHQFTLYFDAGVSHFWVNNTPYYSTITIYSAAPILRYTLNP